MYLHHLWTLMIRNEQWKWPLIDRFHLYINRCIGPVTYQSNEK